MWKHEGKKRFDNCQVAKVSIGQLVFVMRDGEAVRVQRSKLRENEKWHREGGYTATLHCPRTEDEDGVEVSTRAEVRWSQNEARRELRNTAARLVCATCVYHSMTPVEVSITRKELAEAELERIEAYKRLCEARAELEIQGVTPEIMAEIEESSIAPME